MPDAASLFQVTSRSAGEVALLSGGVDLRADVLVASHHGRRSGYFEAVVQAISPTFVVSTGPLATADDAHRLYRASPRRQLLFDADARNDLHRLPRHGLARDRSRAAASDTVVAKSAVASSAPRLGAAVSHGAAPDSEVLMPVGPGQLRLAYSPNSPKSTATHGSSPTTHAS